MVNKVSNFILNEIIYVRLKFDVFEYVIFLIVMFVGKFLFCLIFLLIFYNRR